MPITRTAFGTDPGPRDSLEDTVRAIELAIQASRKWELSAQLVFDGVGGHSYGEVASALGAECFLGHLAGKLAGGMLWDNWTSPSPDSILDLLIESLAFANHAKEDFHPTTYRLNSRGRQSGYGCGAASENVLDHVRR